MENAPPKDWTALGDWIENALSAQPADTVWATAQSDITWEHLRHKVTELNELLGVRGIGPGTTVAVQMVPSYSYLWTVLALWLRGAQVILMDPRLTRLEVNRLVNLCEPQYLITSGASGAVRVVFQDECEIQVERRRGGHAAGNANALLQFSSGATGYPKIIGRTGASLLTELDRFAGLEGMPTAGEKVLLGNSLTHSFGLIGGVLHALSAGATLVFTPNAQPRTLLHTLADSRAQVLFGVPFHFELLNRVSEAVPLPSLRLAVSGGEAIRPEVYEQFEQRYGIRIGQAYGMTETGIIATDLAGRHRPPAVGTPAPGMEVRVRGGELQVRADVSPYVYANDVDNRFVDGWLRTHDLAGIDEPTGIVSVHGRADSLVVIGGLKVDLREVELALAEHPHVTEAVVLFSGTIEAFVGTSGGIGVRELQAWCRDRLSHYKIPRRFELAPAVPRTSNGKLVRNRELLVSRMAGSGTTRGEVVT
ncbi:class I adenylate-forming enzyme family protein [Streptomyces sp. Wh19]|uniref:class I adenylate-forming enzyme family protein n=1 Tax=Streptomyces sp. Wh19 TaxID=3076629 RepID=UPI002958C6AC|nr:class I adenylate-forming enzyme family protein [Streptomyces sp. Wh19]MDV9194738.1 class I adenylate-forming enzyme family protein [Streptomyces sp. Wh19]